MRLNLKLICNILFRAKSFFYRLFANVTWTKSVLLSTWTKRLYIVLSRFVDVSSEIIWWFHLCFKFQPIPNADYVIPVEIDGITHQVLIFDKHTVFLYSNIRLLYYLGVRFETTPRRRVSAAPGWHFWVYTFHGQPWKG